MKIQQLTVLFSLLLTVEYCFARSIPEEVTTTLPDAVAEELETGEPDSAENIIETESPYELIELIERLSLHYSRTGELKRYRSDYWENWVAPYDIAKNFPYYLAGYDEENRPIWVAEFGKWDLRKLVERGNDTMRAFDKYVYQGIYRIYRSFVERSTPNHPVTEFSAILDFDEYDLSQVAHIQTIVYVLGLFRRFHDILDKHLSHAYFINVSYVAERFVTLMRPVVGAVAERLDVYGTKKDKWQYALLRHFPKDALPEWYGGKKDFVPVKVYGR